MVVVLPSPSGVGVMAVVTQFIDDPQADNHAGRYSHHHPGDIDKGVDPVFGDIPESYFQIIGDHRYLPVIRSF